MEQELLYNYKKSFIESLDRSELFLVALKALKIHGRLVYPFIYKYRREMKKYIVDELKGIKL